MNDLTRALAIQRHYLVTEYAGAVAALDPPATETEKQYLRDLVRRHRAAVRAQATVAAAKREHGRPVWETRHA